MTAPSAETAEQRAVRKLTESSLFATYRKAFQQVTGLNIDLIPAEKELPLLHHPSPFCEALNQRRTPAACTMACASIQELAANHAASITCFAGMKETAIPVRAGDHPLAFLRVGEVFEEQPAEADFTPVEARLRKKGAPEDTIEQLRQLYFQGPVIEKDRYEGIIVVLAAFSLQLTEELNRLLLLEENADSPVISKAKQYINAHLDEKIVLDEVAAHVCVSPYYFCKIFKQATGMTLTEYVNRRRVAWAKRKLLNPHARVTEVAYDVGYQSLSQFNRSFLKYAGESPTKFREQAHTDEAMHAA